ncbi:Phenylalanine--tRNA ligase beta subunit [Planctomycetes bacterium MalM25]|nr:Phenylalanine--tRNA ligase beta subunit [Planctomycetes bacterium MalM25]
MIVSTDWLAEYVDLSMPIEELTEKLTLTGLNLEGVETVGDDTAIDLEVTSNRPDCLGHLGVAREIAVIWGQELKAPQPLKGEPQASAPGAPITESTSVAIETDDLCPRYTARLIKGVKIGPSPEWLVNRLATLGVASVNNVVDITNYVMMENGQPLHAFDFTKLKGGKIVVRQAVKGEPFVAINHKEYELTGDEVVIADAERPVALGGVMGGADTEVSEATVEVLIEAADFAPLAVRKAARKHVLFSPSSYRFERGVDPEGIDWASRRCCELILELAGGELCDGVLDLKTAAWTEPADRRFDDDRDHIKLRYNQIPRVLGIEIAKEEVAKILADLGCVETHNCDHCIKVVPPTWRADLTRECDLIEEVARIHGYDKVPMESSLPIVASAKRREDFVTEQVRTLLVGAGFDEAYTLSAVDPDLAERFTPWSNAPGVSGALATGTAVLRRANVLRQSVTPSLLTCRRTNETLSNPIVELFEIAKVYLPREGALPAEKRVLALCSGGGFLELKGVVEELAGAVAPGAELEVTEAKGDLLDSARSAGVLLGGAPFCLLGELSEAGRGAFDLRGGASIAELDLDLLTSAAELVRQTKPLSTYPPVSRDLNVVVDESVAWSAIYSAAADAGGASDAATLVEAITFTDDSFRDAKQLGEGKKSVVFRVQLRSHEGTLTSEQADGVVEVIVGALKSQLGGELRS